MTKEVSTKVGATRWLKQRFPQLFDCEEVRPIALHVRTLLLVHGDSEHIHPVALRQAVGEHVRSEKYLRACAAKGSWRHSLDGMRLEPVSNDHRIYACEQLELRKKQKEK
jgi:sRNA-binding protein